MRHAKLRASMKKITIAVGSMRRPKLNAVWEAVNVIGPTLDADAQFEVVGWEVPSGVEHTPRSREEVMRGARQRAEELMRIGEKRGEPWNYFVGLEGGVDVIDGAALRARGPQMDGGQPNGMETGDPENTARRVFLVSWAYVGDGAGRGYFGEAGGITLPEALAAKVVDQGVELAEAIDEFAGMTGVRDAQGAWGVLSGNLITRQDVFRTAVVNAFAPFYNASLYRKTYGKS
jgi:non-canonical (house-cleaning) NTP pyrophosphatase